VDATTATDAELLAATRRDATAFGVFYDRYEAAIVGYFIRRTRDPELAADLAGEVFAAALTAAPRYRPGSATAAPWLFAIAGNVLVGSLRRGQVEERARRRLGIREPLVHGADELDRVEALGGSERWAEELLERLPQDQRQAVRARVLDERPYADIADQLKTSELVIRKRVSRGLARLRHELEDPR